MAATTAGHLRDFRPGQPPAGAAEAGPPGSVMSGGTPYGAVSDEASNMRVWKMMEEATTFRTKLSAFERSVEELELSSLEFLDAIPAMLHAPLPRVWDNVEGGLAEPIRASVSHNHPNIAGGDADLEHYKAAVVELERRMRVDILEPMRRWSDALDSVKGRMPELERLRREVAKREKRAAAKRRAMEQTYRSTAGLPRSRPSGPGFINSLVFGCTHPRAVLSSSKRDAELLPSKSSRVTGGPESTNKAEQQREFEEQQVSLDTAYKQRKLDAVLESYKQQEALVFETMSGLCQDSSWTQAYAVAAALIVKEAMQGTVLSLGMTKQPVPGFGVERGPPDLDRAVLEEAASGPVDRAPLHDNVHLVDDLPQFIEERPRKLTLDRIRAGGADDMLHARRAVATPMELHARRDLSARDTLPPVRYGASDRPMSPLSSARGSSRPVAPPTPGGMHTPGGAHTPAAGHSLTGMAPITPGHGTGY